MFARIAPIALCAIALWMLVWNAWFRQSSYGDAVVGDAYAALYASIAVLIGALLVMFLPGLRPQDRHWGYATLGMIVGFWLQR
jgi:hypothetical protein